MRSGSGEFEYRFGHMPKPEKVSPGNRETRDGFRNGRPGEPRWDLAEESSNFSCHRAAFDPGDCAGLQVQQTEHQATDAGSYDRQRESAPAVRQPLDRQHGRGNRNRTGRSFQSKRPGYPLALSNSG